MSETRDSTLSSSATDVLGIAIEAQTYKNVLYLLVAFPLGLAYYVFLTFGFIFGVFTVVVGIGIAILLTTVVGARFLAGVERWLANALLRVDLESPNDRPPSDGTWSSVKSFLDAPSTWEGLGFLLLKFWVGIVGVLIVLFLWNMVELITAPLRYPMTVEFGEVNGDPIGWTIDALPEALVAVPIGLVVGLVLLHVVNGFAYAVERMAIALLGDPK